MGKDKEVVMFSLVSCIGSPPSNLEIVGANRDKVTASLTVYKDGRRDLGCTFLAGGLCQAFGDRRDKSKCIHLFPESSSG